MQQGEKVLYRGRSSLGSYLVVDKLYNGRPARVLLSGDRLSALSGLALDTKPELLFDYNQRFLELIIGAGPTRILLLGGGAYTLPIAVMDRFPDIFIDVVEPDAFLEQLAVKFFGLKEADDRLRIFHSFGYGFLKDNKGRYDMIIVDAFDALNVPDSLTTPQAVRYIYDNLENGGLVAMNLISAYEGLGSDSLRRYWGIYDSVFDHVAAYPADDSYELSASQNFLLVARRGIEPLQQYLPFKTLPPPAGGA